MVESTEGVVLLRRNALPDAPGPHVPTVQSPGLTATGAAALTAKSAIRPI